MCCSSCTYIRRIRRRPVSSSCPIYLHSDRCSTINSRNEFYYSPTANAWLSVLLFVYPFESCLSSTFFTGQLPTTGQRRRIASCLWRIPLSLVRHFLFDITLCYAACPVHRFLCLPWLLAPDTDVAKALIRLTLFEPLYTTVHPKVIDNPVSDRHTSTNTPEKRET